MSRDVFDDWNTDGTLPELKSCPFCGGRAILCDNSREEPVIDENGAYMDMDIVDADTIWCECSECGAMISGADTPQEAIAQWNRRCEPPNAPLTLDEFLEMNGEPVYVILEEDDAGPIHGYGIVDNDLECVSGFGFMLLFEDYGAWLAYRHKPEEVEDVCSD